MVVHIAAAVDVVVAVCYKNVVAFFVGAIDNEFSISCQSYDGGCRCNSRVTHFSSFLPCVGRAVRYCTALLCLLLCPNIQLVFHLMVTNVNAFGVKILA